MSRVAILRYPGTWSERDFQHALSLAPGSWGNVLDPLEVIRRNLVPAQAMPYRTATGALLDSGDFGGTLEAAVSDVLATGGDGVFVVLRRRVV